LAALKKDQKTAGRKSHAASSAATTVINVDPKTVQRVLSHAVKAFSNPEYQAQITKLTQASITNSLQTIQKMRSLSGRLSKLNDKDMSTVVEGSINDLTRAILQFNSDQMVLLQKLSTRTLEILENQTREK
jgi:hypothetical protein